MNRPAVRAKIFEFAPKLTPIAIALTAAAWLTACDNLATGGGGSGNTVKIVSSLPMTGSALGQNQSIVNGIKQALDEVNSTVCDGQLKIDYEIYDDATAAAGKWEPAQVTANANKAVADSSVVAVIGHFNSGAAKLSIPILNAANLVMVSPANTYPGLTKPGLGEGKEPDVYYPNGKRNYARVVPTDDIQGVVGAKWAKELGAQKVYILDDQELYGKGLADIFEASAKTEGLEVLGHEGIDPKASDYKALMTKIKALNPDLIYFGGTTQTNAGQLIKDMRNVGMTADAVKFMGPDGIYEQALIDAAGKDAEGVYATFGGVPPAKLTGAGQQWYESYKAKFNSEPEAYAAYGYESAKVAIDAIGQVCQNDRDAIRAAVLNTKDFDGVLGNWSFDENGDTTLKIMSGNVVKDGKWEFVTQLEAQ
ncbi:MAG TPA: branched-chain amino acid ABC transporter substrate-binding protein [Oscillatoriales cyanobacterium M59_W2019_021]|nr:MAG: branched-chain amino acid ABC transporter substrate-binding protein [Cyanobacteria bacterium J055]HIK31022.1 branched-chain amino acid ABC transporter substrate-binding protein [Oscillatoriales cyanobacterium M4454_W2019_049]HIK50454.1 branched-chain amino acid ABC transporter substrate-binding protein [Oscillatoriales cyanobacterium M59_W2019_021]